MTDTPTDTSLSDDRPDTGSDRSESKLTALFRTCEIDARMAAMVVVLIAVWLGMHVLTDGFFLTARNLYNLTVQSSVVGIMATGMVLVIVARHIDLSVGSVMGATGMVIALLQVDVFPLGGVWNGPATRLLCRPPGARVGWSLGAGRA